MNTVTVGNLVRISKRTAKKMYYNGKGIILSAKNVNPLHPMGNSHPSMYSENNIEFDSLINAFTYYNGEPWYWADANDADKERKE